MNLDLFDWCWDKKKQNNDCKLAVVQENEYQSVKYINSHFVITSKPKGNEYVKPSKEYLKKVFEDWYIIASSIEIEPLLDHNLDRHKGNEYSFLRMVRAIILAIHNNSEWEKNFEGKRQIGLLWVEEKLQLFSKSSVLGNKKSYQPRKKWDFNNVFFKQKLTGEELLEKLRGRKFIDDNNNWIRDLPDFKGLVSFLKKEEFVRIKYFATIRDILLTRINFRSYTHPEIEPTDKFIDQFAFLEKK